MTTVDTVKGRYSSYQLLNGIGHGGSARVFRAQDVATKKIVAVKQLFGNQTQDHEDWLREVDALNVLNNHHCPHVIQYFDHMQQHDKLFLVEEYAEHGSLLRQLRENGPMSESAVCNVVFQVLTTLHRMSQWNIIHGDLKASNILLFGGDLVKLTDFALRSRGACEEQNNGSYRSNQNTVTSSLRRNGLAGTVVDIDGRNEAGNTSSPPGTTSTAAGRTSSIEGVQTDSRLTESTTPPHARTAAAAAVAGMERSGDSGAHNASAAEKAPSAPSPFPPLIAFRGSVYWAAPEVLAGESPMTAASDIWAVACTAVELLTGAPPYFDRSIPNATHHVLKYYFALMEGRQVVAGAGADEIGEAKERGDVKGPSNAPKASTTPPPPHYQEEAKMNQHGAQFDKQTEGEASDVDGKKICTRVDEANDSNFLMPPLPDTLHLSEECLSFLRLCLRLRPAERPSAGELLQHPWFLNVVVPPLLQAAREGRGMDGNSPAEEDGIYSNNNTSNANGTNAGSRFAVLEKWVELNLLSDQESRCRAWLEGDALPLLVPVLTPRIMTPKYIGNVMCCFAHFAETNSTLAPLFLDRLGATELWSVEELTSACDADHLVTLFCRCCEAQDPKVAVFTPAHPAALRFVLGLEKAKVQECVLALHRLLVCEEEQQERMFSVLADVTAATVGAAPTTPTLSFSSPGDKTEEADGTKKNSRTAIEALHLEEVMAPNAARQQQQRRRERARERLLCDGGAVLLCQRVESQCKTAFLNSVPPTLEWGTVHRFLEILETVEPLPGGAALLWGFPSEDRAGSLAAKLNVPRQAPAASLMSPHADGVVNNGTNNNNHMSGFADTTGAENNSSATLALISPLSLTPRNPSSPTNNSGFPGTHAATAVPSSNPSSDNNGNGATAHNISSSNFANVSQAAHVYVEWTSSLSWMLAVQESAHHGGAAAIRLLTRYIPLAIEVKAEYLEKAGLSLAATLVLVTSNESVPTELRGAAVDCLPKLQTYSLRAARYLRDPARCVPLLALTLKKSVASPQLTSSMLAALRALTSEKQTFAACVGSPWVWDALLTLLRNVEAQVNRNKLKHNAEKPALSRPDEDRSGGVFTSSSLSSSLSATRNPAQRTLDSAIWTAILAGIVALIAQWLADVSPSALLSMTTAATALNRSATLSPSPPPSSSSVSAAPAGIMQVHRDHSNTSNSGSGKHHAFVSSAAPPSLPVLLQRLRVQLIELQHNDGVRNSDVLPHVKKALEYLAPPDPAVPAASPATK